MPRTAGVVGPSRAPTRASLCPRPPSRGLASLSPRRGVSRVRWARLAARSAAEKGEVQVVAIENEPSPFFEPFVRSFLLGTSFGVLFETLHVTSKVFSEIGNGGFLRLLEAWPSVSERFSPLFLGDHVVAVGSWFLFYIIEAVAIYSVLNKYPDAEEAGRVLRELPTLPRKMLPVRLQLYKQIHHLLSATRKGLLPFVPAPASQVDAPASAALPPATATVEVLPQAPPPPPAGAASAAFVVAPPAVTTPLQPKARPARPAKERGPVAEPSQGVLDKGRERAAWLEDQRTKKGLRPGQMDYEAMLGHRRNELVGRRSFLRNFWYAAGISERVGAAPVGVEVLGEKLVLFRGADGVVHCLHDICPHRGAPLHQGWVGQVGGRDCVVCPYHGWAFDTNGVLRDVPAAEHGEVPKLAIDAFPVEEKGGFIWLFYGPRALPAEERPPIPFVPELENPTWKPVYGEIEFDCPHWSVFENAIDMAHIHYLHSNTFGNQGKPQIRDMTCKTDAFGVTATFALHNKAVRGFEFSAVPEVRVTAKALLPSTSVIAFTLGNGLSFTTFVNTVPINGERTINRFALIRQLDADAWSVARYAPWLVRAVPWAFNLKAWDRIAHDAMLKILGEDKAMVEALRPDMLLREVSVKADLPQTAFRSLRQMYVNMGYGVLPENAAERFRAPS